MSGKPCWSSGLAMSVVLLAGCVSAGETAPRKTLRAFASDREITALFSKWAEEHKRREAAEPQRRFAEGIAGAPVPAPMAAAAPQASAKSASAPAAADSITNVQHAVVDEGGIVKLHGDHLVILRRGRLFTIDVRDRVLKPLSTLDAYGARIDPRGAWYDEMLISGNTIVVIGYSYARGGTEIGLFEISSGGELRYKSTYHLRSNDYYSSRNYASRLIGTRLIFYTPLRLNPWDANPFPRFPAMRRWQSGVDERDFKRIAPATRIYRTDEELDPYQGVALHTVTLCDVAKPELECTSTAVLGPPGRVFYVSGSSVYVWTTTWRHTGAARVAGSAVFRIPLDASAPSALKTAGSPIDQFSFLESEDGHLNVLLRGQGGGEGMWAAEREGGQLALMRVPLSSFSNGKDSAPPLAYRALPAPAPGAMQNRYVGAYLLYGAGAGWRKPQARTESQVYAVTYAGNAPAQTLPLVHGVDRLEALGSNAVAIGSDGKDLHFTTVRLARSAQTVARYTRAGAAQGETRSHGFFYRPQHENNGLAGLPIIGPGRGTAEQLRRTSASLLYLRNDALTLTELGTLDSRADATASDDACAASCTDWYGNSRPLFIGNRVFALLGYEIVEGALSDNRITELRRVSFAPHWVEGLK